MVSRTRVLGQGLAAILNDIDTTVPVVKTSSVTEKEGYQEMELAKLVPSPFQPRKIFDDVELSELASSIKQNGVLQPLIVRKVQDHYEIIAGERRWRASQQVGLSNIPVLVRSITDDEAMVIAFVENLQREDLTALEEAEGLEILSEKMGHSQEGVASLIGKSRSYVANALRLNKLPDEIKDLLRSGKISAGIARSLVGHPNAIELANLAVQNKLNVRELEVLSQKMKRTPDREESPKSGEKVSAQKVFDEGTQEKVAAEKAVEAALGLKTVLTLGAKKKVLSIYFETMEQLDAMLAKLTA